MSLSVAEIVDHPHYLSSLRDYAASLRGQFDMAPRLARMLASHQRWLLSQAALALDLEYDPGQPGSGLTTTNLREIVTTTDAASRNTVLNYLDQLLSYKFVRIAGDPGRRPRRYEATEISLRAMFQWLITNLSLLDELDGGGRAPQVMGKPELFRLIQPQIAHRTCHDPAWRNPPARVAHFLWTEAGGLVMDELVCRAMEFEPSISGYPIGRLDARSLAEQFMISRTHLQRLLRRAVDIGCLDLAEEGRANYVLKHEFLVEYCRWQAIKFSIVDFAYEAVCGPVRLGLREPPRSAKREA
ncbi:hypothetical protein ACSV9I_08325 [Rhizobium sp. G187]|uniref:hypothetical protein n=1 Tax=unclassified Rhizobium TaxID=2613769 RepID=UPI0006B95F9D|nr:hypothetical protein [Rhizobium sp. AAP43]KPF41122.1 hypothetical protein IP76_22405 [Rhizobium sp. AAP43]